MRFGVVQFPGSNCDYDTLYALKSVVKQDTVLLWHKDHDLKGVDCVVLPGGFSYGDYLRSGAIARFSPLMQGGQGLRPQGRARPGHLQRLPGPPRARPPAGGHAPEQGPEVPLPARPHPRRERRHALHRGRPRGPGPEHPHRPLRRQLLRPAADAGRHRAAPPGRLPLLRRRRPGDRGGQRQRLAQQHRRPRRTRPATSWA